MKSDKKEHAQALYLSTKMTIKDIALTIDVSAKSVYKWADEGKWAELKEAKQFTKTEMLTELQVQYRRYMNQLQKTKDGNLTSGNIDALTKLISKIIALSEPTSLEMNIQVMDNFLTYLSKTNPEKAKILSEAMYKYIEQIASK